MASSEMLRRTALVRTDVSGELRASIIRVTRIGELGTALGVTSNRNKPGALGSSEMSVLTRATRRNIPEDGILHSTAVKTSNLTRKFLSSLNSLCSKSYWPVGNGNYCKYIRKQRRHCFADELLSAGDCLGFRF
jgi:hypothetical protein